MNTVRASDFVTACKWRSSFVSADNFVLHQPALITALVSKHCGTHRKAHNCQRSEMYCEIWYGVFPFISTRPLTHLQSTLAQDSQIRKPNNWWTDKILCPLKCSSICAYWLRLCSASSVHETLFKPDSPSRCIQRQRDISPRHWPI